jgi:hypothetical protein
MGKGSAGPSTSSAAAAAAAAAENDNPRKPSAFRRYERPQRGEDPPPDFLLLVATMGSMGAVVLKQRALSWACLLLAISGAARARYGATGPAAVDAKQVAVALMSPIGGLMVSYISPSPEAIAKARAAKQAAAAAAAAGGESEAAEAAEAAAAKAAAEAVGGDPGAWPEEL